MTDTETLIQQRKARNALERRLDQVKALPWELFDHIDSAQVPRGLDYIHLLHRDEFEYPYLQVKTAEGEVRIKRPTFHLNNSLYSFSVFYGRTKAKKDDTETTISEILNVPRTVYLNLKNIYLQQILLHQDLFIYKFQEKGTKSPHLDKIDTN